jgi:hypothetical protein
MYMLASGCQVAPRTSWCGRATLDKKAALPAALKLPLLDVWQGTSRPSGDSRNLHGAKETTQYCSTHHVLVMIKRNCNTTTSITWPQDMP